MEHQAHIQVFFDSIVDISSNKLVLAVCTFIQNEWFTRCAEIYRMMGNIITFPLMKFLGIDETVLSAVPHEKSNWTGVKGFFEHKLTVLKNMMKVHREGESSGLEKLEALVMEEVIDSVQRQLSEVEYLWQDEHVGIDGEALKHAPLTNLECESEFAKLNKRIRISGGSTSVTTPSCRNVVSMNGLLVDFSFESKTDSERKQSWKWTRCSEEVLRVKKLEADFLAIVKVTKKLVLMKREDIKKRKTQKTMHQIDIWKQHGGPATPNSLDILEHLTKKSAIGEVSYLRLTIAPDIRQMRRVTAAEGRYRMEKFGLDELKTSNRNVLKPESCVTMDLNNFLNDVP